MLNARIVFESCPFQADHIVDTVSKYGGTHPHTYIFFDPSCMYGFAAKPSTYTQTASRLALSLLLLSRPQLCIKAVSLQPGWFWSTFACVPVLYMERGSRAGPPNERPRARVLVLGMLAFMVTANSSTRRRSAPGVEPLSTIDPAQLILGA